jgi:hypothetical protein
MVRGKAVATVAGYNPLMVTVGAMRADASEEGPSPWDALWTGEGASPWQEHGMEGNLLRLEPSWSDYRVSSSDALRMGEGQIISGLPDVREIPSAGRRIGAVFAWEIRQTHDGVEDECVDLPAAEGVSGAANCIDLHWDMDSDWSNRRWCSACGAWVFCVFEKWCCQTYSATCPGPCPSVTCKSGTVRYCYDQLSEQCRTCCGFCREEDHASVLGPYAICNETDDEDLCKI